MSLFVISDLHLSLSSKKPMDIFPGWTDYVNILKKNWYETVKKEDTIVICGDISWGMNLNESIKDFEFINSLPGEKIILKGNHDYWWTTVKKIENFFLDNNFNTIKILQNNSIESQNYCICGTRGWLAKPQCDHDLKIIKREVERLKLSLKSAEKSKLEKIVFLHYPPVYFKERNEIMDILIKNKIKYCYYGHIHTHNIKPYLVDNVRFELISCNYLNFRPKLISRKNRLS
ncbi:MAG: metallophosphoesterase [Firmicutes bacterium]|nr:metallophosphoesterase [Bacillota bacterium]